MPEPPLVARLNGAEVLVAVPMVALAEVRSEVLEGVRCKVLAEAEVVAPLAPVPLFSLVVLVA
jgi:hypothetical protein